MKYIKNIAMLMAAFCAMLSVSCSDDTTEDSGVPDRLFRPVGVTLTASGTSLNASWAGISGAEGYWCELYSSIDGGTAADGTQYNNLSLVTSNELVTDTQWTVTGLEPNTTYAFRVKSVFSDITKNSYFTDFYTVKVPAETEVLVCTVVDAVNALVRFEWLEGYDIEWVKITAPDGGVRTIYVDDAAGSFEMNDFDSGTYTAVAGNSTKTYNTVEFLIPILYDVDTSLITFESIHFDWRIDADVEKLVCTNASNPADVVTFDLTQDNVVSASYDYSISEGLLKPATTYVAQLLFTADSGKEPSNTVTFTTMVAQPEGVVIVSTIDELLACVADGTAIIALNPGEYVASENITLTRAITFMSATMQMPKVIVNQFTVANEEYVDGTMRFDGIEFECANLNNTTSCFIDHTGQKANIKRVEIENCYIHDYGSSFLRFNRQETSIEEVYVNNNQLLRMYGQNSFMQLSKVVAREITFTNNTATGLDFQKAGVRFLSYMADDNTVVTFSNNTILFNNSTGRLFFHINAKASGAETAGSVTIANNIFYNEDSANPRNVSNFDSYTVTTNIDNNVVTYPWGASGDSSAIPTETLSSWGNKYFELDPGFKNASGYDFTVTNDEVLKLGVGDPRWR